MANKFNIVITATDKATAVVRKFKDNLSQITRPVRQTMQSFKRFGKEVGLDKIAKGFGAIVKGAGSAAKSIGQAALSLAGVIAVGSAVALAEIARAWAFAGTEILRTAQIIPITTDRLQSLSGAAQIFGLDAKDMQSGLLAIGDAMHDAFFGRNQEAMVLINRLHLKIKTLKDGSVDAADALLQVSRAIQAQRGITQQRLIARTFGVEGLLPLLQKGPAYIQQLEREYKATGAMMDPAQLERMSKFQINISLLSGAITGLGNSIQFRLLPYLDEGVTGLTNFIEWLSDAIAKHKTMLLLGQWASAASGVVLPPPPKKGGPPSTGLFGGTGIFGTPLHIGGGGKPEPLEYDWLNPFRLFGLLDLLDRMNGGVDKFYKPGGGGVSEQSAMQLLRNAFPGVVITSGYRSPEHNRDVGGVEGSYHTRGGGEAVDFVKPYGVTLAQIRDALRRAGVPIKELLDEGDHIHWAWGDPDQPGSRRPRVPNLHGNGRPGQPAGAALPAGQVQGQLTVHFANAPPGTRVLTKPGTTPLTVKIDHALADNHGP